MKELKEYKIPFIGIKTGVHHFNFEPDDTFFAHFKDSLIEKGHVFVDVTFDKKERLFVLNFDISGTVQTECDRCGQMFDLPIYGNYTVYVKIGSAREEDADNEEVIWIAEGESLLDIAEIVYEFIHLSLPLKRVHPDTKEGDPGCDAEILKELGIHKPEQKDSDPRWDILKNLNKN